MTNLVALLVVCLLPWVVVIVLTVRMYRLRRAEPACTRCMHPVIGISSARCPECGGSFAGGVIQPWGKPPRARTSAGIALIVAGVVGAWVWMSPANQGWVWMLRSMGLIYPAYERTHHVDLMWPGGDIMRIEVDLLQPQDHNAVPGTVTLAVMHEDQVLASWEGEGMCRVERMRDPEGVDFDSEEAIAQLASQVDPTFDAPIVQLLHDASGAVRLAAIAQNLALPAQGVDLNLWDLEHRPTGTRVQTRGGPTVVYPAFWWYLPGYLVPFAILVPSVLIGGRLLARRHSLMPFEEVAHTPAPV